MRKLVLGLAVVMVVMGLVGCGTTDEKKNGFVPEQVTESEVVTNDVKENIEEIADGDLTKYYDVEKYVGTPRYTTLKFQGCDNGRHQISEVDPTDSFNTLGDVYYLERIDGLDIWGTYSAIVCDNNTPEDYSDDEIAYIFTTPIEE